MGSRPALGACLLRAAQADRLRHLVSRRTSDFSLNTETSSPPVVELKGVSVPAVRVLLRSLEIEGLRATLGTLLGASPDFFDAELAVADLSGIEEDSGVADWPAIVKSLATYGLRLAAVTNAPGALGSSARAAGLSLLSIPRPVSPRPADEAPPPPPAASEPKPPVAPVVGDQSHTLLLERPLRSGQQIYACGGDIVLLAMANAGSEVIADGSIHVYAPLRGRALAGARGDAGARIFTTSFEAELVSIAGVYRTFEQGIPDDIARRPAQVRLVTDAEGEQTLSIQSLSVS